MARIVGRTQQIKKLDMILASEAAEFLVVYGRRRVGKTFLIREHFKKQLAFDFSGAYGVEKHIQIENFFAEYLIRTKGRKNSVAPVSWNEAFRYLAQYLRSLRKNRKRVVFIDELPWLDTHKSGFVPALEYFWNQYVSRMDHILLVVCGSANSWIQKKLFKSKGGLYNRVTHRIKLEPFTLAETEKLFVQHRVKLSRYQIIELYMAMGGIPHYLKEIQPGKSSIQSIDEICFSKDGLLHDEFNQLYPSIFTQAENHLAIINALSKKPQGLTRSLLVKSSKLSDGGIISRTLSELVDAGFVSIQLPFLKKKKDAIYKLSDFYSLFYYKFIKSNRHSGPGSWEKISLGSAYKAWSGYAFENVCFAHIDQIKEALGIRGIYSKTSSWKFFGNNELPGAQIDLLINRGDQVINLCEAKFSREPFLINKAYAKKLRDRLLIFKHVTNTRKAIFNTLLTTYPPIRNGYLLEQFQSDVTMDALFK